MCFGAELDKIFVNPIIYLVLTTFATGTCVSANAYILYSSGRNLPPLIVQMLITFMVYGVFVVIAYYRRLRILEDGGIIRRIDTLLSVFAWMHCLLVGILGFVIGSVKSLESGNFEAIILAAHVSNTILWMVFFIALQRKETFAQFERNIKNSAMEEDGKF